MDSNIIFWLCLSRCTSKIHWESVYGWTSPTARCLRTTLQTGFNTGMPLKSLEFACSPRVHKGFPPLRTPTEKTCKITEHMSIPDQRWTVHFTWSPGATSCPLLLGGPWGRTVQDGKKQKINSPRPQAYLRVCVCVLCRLHICTCVFQCVVCAIKNLTKVLIIILLEKP